LHNPKTPKKMNIKRSALVLIILCASLAFPAAFAQWTNYDPQFVVRSSVLHNNEMYKAVYMRRSASGNKIKVKYFGARDENGTSVANRFATWCVGKNIICLSSGGYMDNTQTPVGLCIDNGTIVNRTIKDYDGLIIVYATGGMVASNLDNADLTLQGPDIPAGKKFDVRNSAMDRQLFLNWCESQFATVFQTHLLAFKDQLEIKNVIQTPRERRFLAVGKEGNEVVHAIVHSPSPTSLYEGSRRTLEFLNSYKNMEVIFMINLDPGDQDVFFLLDENGKVDNTIQGTRSLADAANLLVYYYE
jgi:hypothetical protein